jgi:ankyrin repeat protein
MNDDQSRPSDIARSLPTGANLIDAVRAGDLDTMRAILNQNPDLANAATDLDDHIRPSDAPAMRLIHLAVAENRMDAARLLVEFHADLNVRNADGRLPLHDCFELGRDEFAQFLMAAGAQADVCAAAAYGMHDRLRELLARDPLRANDLQTGISPVGWSVYGGQEESARVLLAHGAIVDHSPYDVEAWAAVAHVANIKFAGILLEHGSSPNCRNRHGDTPMHAAIKSRLVRDPSALVELLLAAGADTLIRNVDGRTALDEALLQVGKVSETYFPARPVGEKKLDRVIEMLKGGARI